MKYRDNMILSLEKARSPISEVYRVLRTNIQFSSIDKVIKTIVITSSMPAEGKTVTAVNMAVIFAQNGSKILLIDADLRKPRIHKMFNINSTKGLANIIALRADLNDCIHRNVADNLDVITCGSIPPNPSELLSSNSMKELIEKMSNEYDYIFIDSPPAGVVTDAAILSAIVDGTILVIASGQTEISHVQNTKEQLRKVNANIIGVILNKMKKGSGRDNYFFHHYYTDFQNKLEKRRKKIKR